ncbi:Gfo/Idh/MocA family oxidoreductase [Dactylosporangium sp. CA-233914]|uniref:Gfo/Idh/MocA family oxidoreductase n=1 Tax=Dactylosporangium sp. CA-233914 TaxID=3239934 RepID=UPI003D945B55
MSERRPDRLPVALIGFGGSGSGIHRPLIAANPRLSLDVVVTRDAARAEAARRQCPDAHVTSEALAAKGCAVAVVALPPAYRGDVVERLIDHGVHVVVEKPMATSLEAAARLAEHDNARLTVFHNRRWDSDFLTLQRLRSEQWWTGPTRLESRIQWWQPTVRDGWRNRSEGGGILREVGTHLIDQAITLLGPATAVYAELRARRRGAIAEDEVFVALEHADGSRSHLSAGPLGDPDSPRFQVAVEEVLITLGTPDRQQADLADGLVPGTASWGVTDPSDWVIRRGSQPPAPVTADRGRWQAFYDGVASWVADGGAPPVPWAEGLATMRVIDAARRASAAAQVVHLGEGG